MFLLVFLFSAQLSHAKTSKTKAEWSLLAKVFAQADSIEREVWWVATKEKRPLSQSVFGKIFRAAMRENKQKLSQKNLFDCDRFIIKKEKALPLNGYSERINFFHACQKSQAKNEFATLEWQGKSQIKITFYPQYLKDVVGLTTSILAKPFHCEIKLADQGLIEELSCDSLRKDKAAEETLEYEKFLYKKSDQNEVEVVGSVYENIKKKRKVEFTVPLKGDIFVKETELIPPAGYRVPQPKTTLRPPTTETDKLVAPPPRLRSTPPVQTQPTQGGAAPDQIQNGLAPGSHSIPADTPSLPEPEYIEEGVERPVLMNPSGPIENSGNHGQENTENIPQPEILDPIPEEQNNPVSPVGPPPIQEPSNR